MRDSQFPSSNDASGGAVGWDLEIGIFLKFGPWTLGICDGVSSGLGNWRLDIFHGQCLGRNRMAFLFVPSTSTLCVSTEGSSLSALWMMRRSKAFIGSSSTISPQR